MCARVCVLCVFPCSLTCSLNIGNALQSGSFLPVCGSHVTSQPGSEFCSHTRTHTHTRAHTDTNNTQHNTRKTQDVRDKTQGTRHKAQDTHTFVMPLRSLFGRATWVPSHVNPQRQRERKNRTYAGAIGEHGHLVKCAHVGELPTITHCLSKQLPRRSSLLSLSLVPDTSNTDRRHVSREGQNSRYAHK